MKHVCNSTDTHGACSPDPLQSRRACDQVTLAEYYQSVFPQMDATSAHAAERWPIHVTSMHTKADDPASVLIHDDHYPVTLQYNRFTAEQVYAPQAVFSVADCGQPGRSVVVGIGLVVGGESSTYNILVEF